MRDLTEGGPTIVPLLSSAPLAQNEFVSTSSGWTVLVSKFQIAPHAEWPLICSGSFEARSNMTTRLGETTIASRATMPEVTFFRSNRHCGSSGADGAAYEDLAMRESRGRRDHFILSMELSLVCLDGPGRGSGNVDEGLYSQCQRTTAVLDADGAPGREFPSWRCESSDSSATMPGPEDTLMGEQYGWRVENTLGKFGTVPISVSAAGRKGLLRL